MGRLGGDEFIVLMPHLADEIKVTGQLAENIAERRQEAVSGPLIYGEITLSIHASVGVCMLSSRGLNAEAVIGDVSC